MKLYKVTFNDGEWHTGDLPSEVVIADNKENARDQAIINRPYLKSMDWWATEIKQDGYEIIIKQHNI